MALLLKLIFLTILTICVNGEQNTTDFVISGHGASQSSYHKVDINGRCDINKNCSHNTVCIDNYCRCKPNYRWNQVKRSCESYNCESDEHECKRYDPNRVCSNEYLFGSECKCKQGYSEDQKNHKCRQSCLYNYECDPDSLVEHKTNHLVCVDFVCQCRPNFRWNLTSNRCENFTCSKDSECWGNGDENRECVAGVCECNYEEDFINKKCYLSFFSLFKLKNYHSRKETLLICTLFIIPTVTTYCIYSYYRKRRRIVNSGPTIVTKEQLNSNFIYPTKQ